MAADVEKHQKSTVGPGALKRELELGRQIQNDMLPHAPLRLGLTEIKGVSVPAREVGGDFFNYFEIGPGAPGKPRDIALLVGDVSGKGVGAALLMANIQASLRTRLALGPGSVGARRRDRSRHRSQLTGSAVCDALCRHSRSGHAPRCASSTPGHHPQYVLRKGGALERMESTGLPVGLLSGRGHREQTRAARTRVTCSSSIPTAAWRPKARATTCSAPSGSRACSSSIRHGRHGRPARARRVRASARSAARREPFDDATMMAVRVG